MKEFNESYGHTDNLKLCGFCYFVLFYFHYYTIENWENEQGFCCIKVDYDPMIQWFFQNIKEWHDLFSYEFPVILLVAL